VLTRRALEIIRESLQNYWYVLCLLLVLGLVSAVASGASTLGSAAFGTSGAGSSSSTLQEAGSIAGPIEAVLVLITLVLVIYAFVHWRKGANELKRWAGEYGSEPGRLAVGAREDISRATRTFIVGIVLAFILGIAALVVLLSSFSFSSTLGQNNTTTSFHVSSGARVGFEGVLVVLVVVEIAISYLVYAFATRSLVNSVAAFTSTPLRDRLVQGRRWGLIGGALTLLGVLGEVVPYGSLVAVVPALLIIYGYHEILEVYNEVLNRELSVDPTAVPALGLTP
jgi:hypothetical protein